MARAKARALARNNNSNLRGVIIEAISLTVSLPYLAKGLALFRDRSQNAERLEK